MPAASCPSAPAPERVLGTERSLVWGMGACGCVPCCVCTLGDVHPVVCAPCGMLWDVLTHGAELALPAAASHLPSMQR